MYTIIEYIWLDSISEFRSKTKVLMKDNVTLSDLSDWNYTCISLLGEGRSNKLLQYKLYPVPSLSRNYIDWNPDPIP